MSRRGFSIVGLWRRLVARSLGVGEVGGSNPLSPTKVPRYFRGFEAPTVGWRTSCSELAHKEQGVTMANASWRAFDSFRSNPLSPIIVSLSCRWFVRGCRVAKCD